jgi:hypothetical protein
MFYRSLLTPQLQIVQDGVSPVLFTDPFVLKELNGRVDWKVNTSTTDPIEGSFLDDPLSGRFQDFVNPRVKIFLFISVFQKGLRALDFLEKDFTTLQPCHTLSVGVPNRKIILSAPFALSLKCLSLSLHYHRLLCTHR